MGEGFSVISAVKFIHDLNRLGKRVKKTNEPQTTPSFLAFTTIWTKVPVWYTGSRLKKVWTGGIFGGIISEH